MVKWSTKLFFAVGVVIFSSLACNGVRLPKNVIPVHYDVAIRTQLHTGAKDLQGRVQIIVDVLESTTKIVLHGLGILIREVNIRDSVGNDLGNPEVGYDSANEQVILTTSKQLEVGTYLIWIKYEATNSTGWVVQQYEDAEGIQRYFLATQFEPTYARTAFPCFDEPGMKATFSLDVEHHKSMSVDSNMPLIGMPKPSEGEYVVSAFMKTPKMSTYSLAFTVADGYRSSGSGNHTTKARGSLLEKTLYPLKVAKEILGVMDQYTGLPYKDYLSKLTHLEVPLPSKEWGAKENWGLIMYPEGRLSYDPKLQNLEEQRLSLLTISQELAHMWFGNLVTPEWWDSIWLKEGFAAMYMYYGMHRARPSEHWMEWFNLEARNRDKHRAVKIERTGSILNMFRQIVGDATWQQIVKNFLKNHQLSAVVPSDLYVEIEKATKGSNMFPADITIEQIMNSWMTSQDMPILRVKRNYNESSITVSKHLPPNKEDLIWVILFNYTNPQHPTGPKQPQNWIIPYNYAEEFNADFDEVEPLHWLAEPSTVIPTNATADQWILFSKRHFSVYRINYDERNWKLLAQALRSNISCMPRENRAQLLSDARYFSINYELKQTVMFDLLTFLPNETESLVWYAALPIIDSFKLELRSVKYQDYFKTFLHHLTKRFYDNIQQTPPTSLYDESVRKSVTFLACQAGNPDCLSASYQTFQRSFQANSSDLLPDDLFNVFCFGLQQASDAEFAWALYEYEASAGNDYKQEQLIKALLCSKQSERLRIVLKRITWKHLDVVSDGLEVDLSAEQFWVLVELMQDDLYTDGLNAHVIQEILVGMSMRKQSEQAQTVMEELKEKYSSKMRRAGIGYIVDDYTSEHGNPNNKMNKMLEEFIMRNNL